MMSDKAARILGLLLSNDGQPMTVKKITGVLEMSERTVGTYLKEVYSFCKQEGIEVVNKPGVGIIVRAGDKGPALQQKLKVFEKNYYTSDYRVGYMVELLLWNWTTYTISLFADDLHVSKTTIESDLRAVEKWLADYEIQVVRKVGSGICLSGKELDIRRAMVAINRKFYRPSEKPIPENLDYRLSEETWQRLAGCARGFDLNKLIWLIQRADQNASRDLTDVGFETLLEYLIVMQRRMKGNYFIKEGELLGIPDDRPNMESYLSTYVEEMNLPRGEQQFLALIVCCLEYQNPAARRDELFAEAKSDILRFTDKLIRYLGSLIGLDFEGDELLRKTLYMFERSSLLRVKFGIDLENPFREEIKKTYPAIFSACSAAGELYRDAVDRYPTENEICSLCLLVGGAVVRSKKKITAVVVCAAGIGTAQIVARKIEDKIPGVHVIATLSFSELSELTVLAPMMVITTIRSVECDIPTVNISPVVSEEDIRRLNRACSRLYTTHSQTEENISLLDILREELIFLDVPVKPKEKLLYEAADMMREKGFVSESFYQDVIRREEMGITAVGQGVAIPHGVSGKVKQPAITLIRLNQSIDWGGEPVDLIFVLALNFRDIRTTKAFFRAFYQLTADERTLTLMRKAQKPEEIRKIIAEHCY